MARALKCKGILKKADVFQDHTKGVRFDVENIDRITARHNVNPNARSSRKKKNPKAAKRVSKKYINLSEERAQQIDKEVSRILAEQYSRAKKVLSENKVKVEKLGSELLEKEVIFKADLEKIFGERKWKSFEENQLLEMDKAKKSKISKTSKTSKKDDKDDKAI